MNKYPNGKNGMSSSDSKQNNKQKDKFVRTNWKIKAQTCRIIEDGKPPRIGKTRDMLNEAQALGLDLVEIAYDFKTGISTCRICDYGKYQYEQKRKEKMAKKQAKANRADIKCLQLSLTTDTADLNRLIEHAKEFLEDGDKVKLALRFRGRRELANVELGKKIMLSVLSNFENLAVLDSGPVLNGKELSCVIRKGQPKKPVQS